MSEGFVIPLMVVGLEQVGAASAAIGKLSKATVDGLVADEKAAKAAAAAFEALEKKLPGAHLRPTKVVQQGQAYKRLMDDIKRQTQSTVDNFTPYTKLEKSVLSLTVELHRFHEGLSKLASAQRIELNSLTAETAAIERQEIARQRAAAGLKTFSEATYAQTRADEMALAAKKALIDAPMNRKKAASDVAARAEDLKDPVTKATEQQKVRNARTLDNITANERAISTIARLKQQSKELTSQDRQLAEAELILARAEMEAATAGQKEVAALAKLNRETKLSYDNTRLAAESNRIRAQIYRETQLAAANEELALSRLRREVTAMTSDERIAIENDRILAKAKVDLETATNRETAAIDRRNRELVESRSDDRKALTMEEARVKVLNDLTAAEARAAARKQNGGATYSDTVKLNEQARLEQRLIELQARRSAGLKSLVSQIAKLEAAESAAAAGASRFSLRINLAAQAAAAMRSTVYGLGASFGIFTSATLLIASSVFAAVSAVRAGVTSAVSYEQALSNLGAMSSDAAHGTQQYTSDLTRLSEAVKRSALESKYSTVQTAEAMKQLALAGLSYNEVIAATPATMRLATIGAMDFAQAAEIATNIMMGFGLSVRDLPRVVDVISKAATESNANVQELGLAMSYAAPLAESFGISLEYTAAAMEVMANAGIKGSRGGTGFRKVLLSLFTPTEKVNNEMKQFGITLENLGENAQLEGLDGLPVALGAAADGASKAQKMFEQFYVATDGGTRNLKLFKDGVGIYGAPAMTQLTKSVGLYNKSIQEFAKNNKDAADSSKEQADKMLDNLLSVFDQVKAAGSVLATNVFVEMKEPIRSFFDKIKEAARYLAATQDRARTLYAALADLGTVVLRLVEAFVAYRAVMIGVHLLHASMLGIGKLSTGILAVASALWKVPAAIAAIRLSVQSVGVMATAGGFMSVLLGGATLGTIAAVTAAIAALGAAAYYVYQKFSGVPEALESSAKAYDMVAQASSVAADKLRQSYNNAVLDDGLRNLYAERKHLEEQIAAQADKASEQANELARAYGKVKTKIAETVAQMKQYASVTLAADISKAGEEKSKQVAEYRKLKEEEGRAISALDGANPKKDNYQSLKDAAKAARENTTLAALRLELTVESQRMDIAKQRAMLNDDEAKRSEMLASNATDLLRVEQDLLARQATISKLIKGGSKDLFDQQKLAVVSAFLEEVQLRLAEIGQMKDILPRKAAMEPVKIYEQVDAAAKEFNTTVKKVTGSIEDQKREVLGLAKAHEEKTRKELSDAQASYTRAKEAMAAYQEGTAAYEQHNAALQTAASTLLEAYVAQGAALTSLNKAQKEMSSGTDGAVNAFNRLAKSAASLHEEQVTLIKDFEDFKHSMVDLDENILARGADMYDRLRASAVEYGKTLKEVSYSGLELPGVGEVPSDLKTGARVYGSQEPTTGRYADLVNKYGTQYGVSPDFISRILAAEKSGPTAISLKGAVGVAQFMPDTAKRFGVTDRTNVDQSIEGMTKYLKFLLDRYNGNEALAAAGYNAGEGAVDKAGGVPNYKETRNYVAMVTGGSSVADSANRRTLAITDEMKSVKDLTGDLSKLQKVEETSAQATANRFDPVRRIAELQAREVESLNKLAKRREEAVFWQNRLSEVEAAGNLQTSEGRAIVDAATAAKERANSVMQQANALREAQLKWEEYSIRTGRLNSLVVARSTDEYDAMRDSLVAGEEAQKDYNLTVAEANKLLSLHRLTTQEYAQAVSDAARRVAQAKGGFEAFYDSLRYDSKDFEDIGVKAFTSFRDTMADALATGKVDFENFLTYLRDAAARFAADKVMEVLFKPAASSGGGGGLLSGLVSIASTAIAGYFGGSAPASALAGPAFVGPVQGVSTYAHGGAFSAALPFGVYSRPTFFPMRTAGYHAFASGGVGLLGEAGRSEVVLPLARDSHGDLSVNATGAAPQVNVVVNTRPGDTAKVSQQGNTLTIDVIEKVLAGRIASGGSALPRAVESTYGSRRS